MLCQKCIFADPGGPAVLAGGSFPVVIDSSGGGGGFFIATAVYGSALSNEVSVFERMRDKYFLTNELGRAFVSSYYKYSRPLADWIAKHPTMRRIVRIGLYPVLGLSKCFIGEIPSNER